jgi:hypothetical protein
MMTTVLIETLDLLLAQARTYKRTIQFHMNST